MDSPRNCTVPIVSAHFRSLLSDRGNFGLPEMSRPIGCMLFHPDFTVIKTPFVDTNRNVALLCSQQI